MVEHMISYSIIDTTELSRETRKQFETCCRAAVVHQLSQRSHSPQYKLYFYNFFTNYSVLELLAEKEIHATGTERNPAGCQRHPSRLSKTCQKKEEGAVSRDGKVALGKWFETGLS